MMESTGAPHARRRNDLLTQEVEHELLVFDPQNQRVHALNPIAAQVWNWCDGSQSVEAMAHGLDVPTLSPDQARAVVHTALRQLSDAGLLENHVDHAEGLDRRRVLKGLAAAMVPVLVSAAAPRPAVAQSPSETPCVELACCNCSTACGGFMDCSTVGCAPGQVACLSPNPDFCHCLDSAQECLDLGSSALVAVVAEFCL